MKNGNMFKGYCVVMFSLLLIAILAIIGANMIGNDNDKLTQKMAEEFSCGVGDVEYFCDNYCVTPRLLNTSIVLKRSFTEFLGISILNSDKFNKKVKK